MWSYAAQKKLETSGYKAPKNWDNKSPNFEIPKKKGHSNVAPWKGTQYIIGRKAVASSQI
jgi:hypothetical protein